MEGGGVRIGFGHGVTQKRDRLHRLSGGPHQEIELRAAVVKLPKCEVEKGAGGFGGAEILAVPGKAHHSTCLTAGAHFTPPRTLSVEEPVGERRSEERRVVKECRSRW